MFSLSRWARAFALVLTFTTTALVPSLAPQTALASTAPLPACTYSNVMTRYTSAADWRITLVDTALRLPRNYVPPDLVSTAAAGLARKQYVRALVIPDLTALAEAAAANGTPIRVVSAYRSYRQQRKLFRAEVALLGPVKGRLRAARAGHSEHQLGTAIDFGGTGAWMAQNAWRFGFIMSYPYRDPTLTCYRYEPWHYRYVGREMAAQVHDSGLSLREYLWQRYYG